MKSSFVFLEDFFRENLSGSFTFISHCEFLEHPWKASKISRHTKDHLSTFLSRLVGTNRLRPACFLSWFSLRCHFLKAKFILWIISRDARGWQIEIYEGHLWKLSFLFLPSSTQIGQHSRWSKHIFLWLFIILRVCFSRGREKTFLISRCGKKLYDHKSNEFNEVAFQ